MEKLPPAPPRPQTHLPWCECLGWEGKGPGSLVWVHSDAGEHPAPETYLHYPRSKHRPVALSSRGRKSGLHIPKGQLKPRSKCTQTPASPSADSGPPEKGLPGRLLQHRAGRGPNSSPGSRGPCSVILGHTGYPTVLLGPLTAARSLNQRDRAALPGTCSCSRSGPPSPL